MPSRETEKAALDIASLATLIAALALSVPVIERGMAAIWQWYKFAGYSNDGHISLSFNTGLVFSALLAVTFGLAASFHRIAKRRSDPRAESLSLFSMVVVVAVALAYWLLGISGLNVWRA